jgi:hypothetical protein
MGAAGRVTAAPSPSSLRRAARPLALAGRHRLFTALLVAGTILRVLTTMAYRPAMQFVQDSFDYLEGARHLTPGIIRPMGYPLFLRALSLGDRLTLVPITQHLLGLAMAVAVYALVRHLGGRRGWAALAAAPLLLDPYQVYLEQFLMAETLFEALTVGAVLLLLWHERPSPLACAVAGLGLAASALTRSAGLLLIVPAAGFLVARRAGWLRVACLAAAAVVLLGSYATWFHQVHGSFALEAYDGYFLAGRVEPFADCRGLSLSARERLLCDDRPPARRQGSDWFIWNPDSPMRRKEVPTGTDRNAVAASFARKVLRNQPGDYLHVVLTDTLHYLSFGRHTGAKDNPVQSWQYRTSFSADPWQPEHPPADPYVYQWTWPGRAAEYNTTVARHGFSFEQVRPRLNRSVASRLRTYQRYVYTPGPVLGAFVLAGLLVGVGRLRREDRRLRWSAAFLAVSGLLLPLTAAATSTFDYRYLVPSLPLLATAGALSLTLGERRLAAHRRRTGGGGEAAAQSWQVTAAG